MNRVWDVLFLCTGNSARSILAECILRRLGGSRFRAHSAGSHPQGVVQPEALRLLKHHGHDTDVLRSKSWDEYLRPGAPPLDFVITVCGAAASELCPVWPGKPSVAYWPVEDPADADLSPGDRELRFVQAHVALEARIDRFVGLELDRMEGARLAENLQEIGKMGFPGAVLQAS